MSKTKVLFVCLGNICRSPAAEAVFKNLVNKVGSNNSFFIDSAATCDHHIGEKSDSRMRETANKRGVEITSLGRQFTKGDFTSFDFIIVMDNSNFENIMKLSPSNEQIKKVSKMTDYCSEKFPDQDTVPDPYFGDMDGFEFVLDLLQDASTGLLTHINSKTV